MNKKLIEKAQELLRFEGISSTQWKNLSVRIADFAEECIKEERKRIAELLKQFSTVSKDALDIIEREGFVFDHSGGRWEKLAFTFYSSLVGVSADAQHALEDLGDDQTS